MPSRKQLKSASKTAPQGAERLQKILARAGYGSRRACEEMIAQGRVTVDGRIARLGEKADPTRQEIRVDGALLRKEAEPPTYIALYKPRGVISTVSDPQGRRTVRDYIPLPQRLYPVGRLDADSEGLILMTNDGEITQRLTHPRYRHPRVYRVLVRGIPSSATLQRWRRGIRLEDGPARFDRVEIESGDKERTWLRVTLHEGRKHLVRRVVAALGHPALRLVRVAMGPIELGNLAPGKWRYLSQGEIRALRELARRAAPTRRRSLPRRRPARRTRMR